MAACVAALGLFLGGCGNDDSGTTPGPDTDNGDPIPVNASVSGTWQVATTSGDEDSGTLVLRQDGTAVRGTFSAASGYEGTVAGEVDGADMTVELTYSTGSSMLSATITGNVMSGAYTAVTGQSGTFRGTR